MKQRPSIILTAPANTRAIVNASRLERRKTIPDLFRQLWGVLALLAAGIVHAAPVTYYFGGQLAYVEPSLSPAFAIGNEFNGTFTYESTTADSAPSDPNRGFYGTGPAFTLAVNSLLFSIAGGGSGSVYVFNDYFGSDEFGAGSAGAVTTGPNINGFFPDIFYVRLGDSTHSVFSSDALPSTEPDLALFDSSHFELGFVNYDTLSDARIWGALSYLSLTDPNATTSIPEPGSLALLGLGLAGLGASIKRNLSRNEYRKPQGLTPINSIKHSPKRTEMKMLRAIPTMLITLLLIVFASQYSTVATAQDGNAGNAECRGRCGSSLGGSGSRSAGKPSNSGSDAAALMSLGQGLLELSRQQKAREARENNAVLDNSSAGANVNGSTLSKYKTEKEYCNACHRKEKKLVGPSWNDISNRYSASQLDFLAKTARYGNEGGSKNWGNIHCPGEASLSEERAKSLVSELTGIRPVANSSPPSSNNSVQQTGNCRQNLAHLSSRIPSFSAPEISGLRSSLLETDIRQTISAAKQQGYGPNQAVDASLQQARENDRVARQGAECASDVDAWGTTDEAFYRNISAGKIDRQINCQGSIRNSCLCAAIVNKMTAVGSRAIAAEMQCYIKNNRW